jgi:aspartate racemase
MKKIGIVGGMGPESTIYYYRTIIDLCRENSDLKGNFPEMVIYNLNLVEMMELAGSNEEEYRARITAALEALYKAGVDFGIIACNTVHMYFERIQVRSPLPLLSIVEETYKEVATCNLKKVGLLGTEKTMNSHYYQDVFNKHDISIVVPQAKERAYVNEKIMTELVSGIVVNKTWDACIKIIKQMIVRDSIQGLVLGCTELPLLITQESANILGIPVFDTARIHAKSALLYALSS